METSHVNKSSWEIFDKTKKGDGVQKVGLDVTNLDLTLTFQLYGIKIFPANMECLSGAQH